MTCLKANSLVAVSVLPPCSTNQSDYCVESFSLQGKSGAVKGATLVREFEGVKIPAAPDLKLAFGGTMSLWEAVNEEGQKKLFIINAYQQFQSLPKGADCTLNPKPNECLMKLGRLSLTIVPVSSATADCISLGAGGPKDCFKREDFALDETPTLVVRVDSRLSGFLSGRITNSIIDVQPLSKELNALKISGVPQDIPTAQSNFTKNELANDAELLAKVKKGFGQFFNSSDTTVITGAPPGGDFSQYLLLGEKAEAVDTVKSLWRVQSFTDSSSNKCLDDSSKLLGFVTTNAANFQSSPPSFNRTTSTLEYQVGSPHFDVQGKVFKGRYELILRSEVARCLYGFTAAPVQATISIVGESDVATTIQSEKNGWLTLGAYNFEFSNPIIKVRLIQKKLNIEKKITITCVKGKSSKKVTAVKPVCPPGYKKK